jgi:hypothetical protein
MVGTRNITTNEVNFSMIFDHFCYHVIDMKFLLLFSSDNLKLSKRIEDKKKMNSKKLNLKYYSI